MESMESKELQELREQFNHISDKLEKQTIINETLIKESMKKNVSYVEKTYKLYTTAGKITIPIFILFLVVYKAPISMWIFIVAALIVEMLWYRREFRKLNVMELMSLGHIEAVERVTNFKKNIKKITIVMLLPAIVLFILFVGLLTDYKFDMYTVIYYAIFCLLAFSYELVRTKRMFSKLDAVLKQIKDLRSEE